MAILTDKSSNSWVQRGGPADGDFIDGDEMAAYLDQLGERTNYLYALGICPYNPALTYTAGAFCQVAGVVYRAIAANTGKPPASNPAIWTRCPMTEAEIADAINLSDKQPVDATLTALANLTTAADQIPYATGADAFAMTPLTPFARTLLDDANAAAALATLGAAPLASPALTGAPTAPTASTGTRSTQLATTAFVGAESQIAAPTGSVYTFAGSTVPTGWLKCNGALLSRTTYAALFSVIGTTYGAGDGSTTFALPDLRGEFVRGVDDGRGVDAGRVLGGSQAQQTQAHKHISNMSDAYPGALFGSSTTKNHRGSSGGIDSDNFLEFTNDGTTYNGTSPNSSDVIGAETRPRNVAMHYIIKY